MNYIVTRSGGKFWYDNPMGSAYTIEDIAASLSKLCRFVGHTREMYSVAEHSVLVSRLVPRGMELAGLLHDASEAFCGDIASPLKAMLPEYKQIEDRVQGAIMARFGVQWDHFVKEQVKRADLIALATEKRDLLPICEDWDILRGVSPSDISVEFPYRTELAEAAFLEKFYRLKEH